MCVYMYTTPACIQNTLEEGIRKLYIMEVSYWILPVQEFQIVFIWHNGYGPLIWLMASTQHDIFHILCKRNSDRNMLWARLYSYHWLGKRIISQFTFFISLLIKIYWIFSTIYHKTHYIMLYNCWERNEYSTTINTIILE